MNSFSVLQVLGESWKLFRKQWFFFVSTLILLAIVNLVPSFLAEAVSEENFIVSLVFRLAGWAINIVTSIGMIKITTGVVSGRIMHYKDLFNGYPRFLSYLLTTIIVGFIVLVGIVLLVIPGIIFALKLQFAVFYAVDQGLGPIAAIQASWRATKGNVLRVLGLDLMISIISLLGLLVFMVGLLVAVPIGLLAVAVAYKKLSGMV